jgi:predicted RNase H-like nuclease (RuvC/YqgF family)
VVQTGEMQPGTKTEATDDKTEMQASDKLGIFYSDIIPVAVKAIQEQQKQLEELKLENNTLKEKNEQLQKDIETIKLKLGLQ